ncbi:MAG: hydrolase, partial [Armatimonadetes bacterium]|nr:hydrolase [Armatimonadota bacterium]
SIPGGQSCKLFAELAKDNGVFVVGSVYERGGLGFRKLKGARYDTAVLMDPGGNVGGVCRKQHIPADIGYYETEYFGAGNSDYPVFGLPDIRLAMPTCYDQWFPELARIFSLKGTELIVYPTAIGSEPSEPGFDSQEAWATILRSHAVANGVFVAAANRVGTEENITFYGSSVIVAPDGTVLAQGSRDNEELISADLDPDAVDRWRRLFPLLLRREPETYGTILGRLSLKTPEERGEVETPAG